MHMLGLPIRLSIVLAKLNNKFGFVRSTRSPHRPARKVGLFNEEKLNNPLLRMIKSESPSLEYGQALDGERLGHRNMRARGTKNQKREVGSGTQKPELEVSKNSEERSWDIET